MGDQIGIAYAIVTTVLFVFPPDLPVTGNNMNYCIVAFAIIFIISLIQWYVDGKKNFKGPQIDIASLEHGVAVGMAVEPDEHDQAFAPIAEKRDKQL